MIFLKGIKEMNKSFGHQQQTDELASMANFKELMQQMHKTNAQLETERIELQVKAAKLKEELDQVRVEKENLNRKFLNADQLNQRLQSERSDVDANFRRQLDLKQTELLHLNNELASQRDDNERLKTENESLFQTLADHEQLKLTHAQLTQHYEQLYSQASEIVAGNQLLNEQLQTNALQIQQLSQLVEDYQMKIDHLEHCNSELNTQKINLDMKLVAVECRLAETESDLKELNLLRNSKMNVEKLNQLNKDLELELLEKNELIEQLNQAKDFLAENNSKLLTNNIRIQLFVESMGLDLNSLETNANVNEYDSLRSEFKEVQYQLNEIKILNQQLEINQQNFKDLINNKELEIKSLLSQLNEMKLKFEALTSIVKLDATEQTDFVNIEEQQNYSEQLAQYELNFNNIQNENEQLSNQLDETRSELNELKQKYEEAVKDKSRENSQELLNELNTVKAKYEETVQKQNGLEQLNLKLKAKLKQFVKEQQKNASLLAEQKSNSSVPSVSPVPPMDSQAELTAAQNEVAKLEELVESLKTQISSKTSQLDESNSETARLTRLLEQKTLQVTQLDSGANKSTGDASWSSEANLICFGSRTASQDLCSHVASRVDELKNGMNLFLLNNDLKIQAAYKEAIKYKEKTIQLEEELNNESTQIWSQNTNLMSSIPI